MSPTLGYLYEAFRRAVGRLCTWVDVRLSDKWEARGDVGTKRR